MRVEDERLEKPIMIGISDGKRKREMDEDRDTAMEELRDATR